MKRVIALVMFVAFASTVVSCGQSGQKDTTAEIAAKAAELIAEQQKKTDEEKAKLEKQVQDEVQKQMAQKEAEAKAAADAQAAAEALAAAQKPTAKSSTKTKVVVANPYQKHFQRCMSRKGAHDRTYCDCYANQIAKNLKPNASKADENRLQGAAVMVCRLRK